MTDAASPARYRQPDWFSRHVAQPAVSALVSLGVSIRGARELRVRGRKTGAWRAVPVNPLTFEGQQYLVAPRGETQWVRNLRAAGTGELRLGRRTTAFRATEVPDEAKVELLRAYLRRWKFEVGAFFAGVGPDSSDEEIAAIASRHPVFRIDPSPAPTARDAVG